MYANRPVRTMSTNETSRLAGIRTEYRHTALLESDVDPDPIRQFARWFEHALRSDVEMANAMVLATAAADGRPSARYVLLKKYDTSGFVFYTHSQSRKGIEMKENPRAALILYWAPQHRQVRIEGTVEVMPDADADEYFDSRPYGSRLSASVAVQSTIVQSRETMEEARRELDRRCSGGAVPRPDGWIGYRVRPESVEFWQGREDRLHDRLVYARSGENSWSITRLAP